MKASEMFEELVHDCLEISVALNKEAITNGMSDRIQLLSGYVDSARVSEGYLFFQMPFPHKVPANDKMKIEVLVKKYICELKSIASQIFEERRNFQTNKIFSMTSRMYEKFEKCILELE